MSLKNQTVETKEKKDAPKEDKDAKGKQSVIKSFAKLSAKDRTELYAELREAVNEDNNQLSQGKEPADTKHYDALLKEEE